MSEPFILSHDAMVNHGWWRMLPPINVDKLEDIPCDYPGVMGVPITIVPRLNPDQFEIIDIRRGLQVNGHEKYWRVLVRNLSPQFDEMDISAYLKQGIETAERREDG